MPELPDVEVKRKFIEQTSLDRIIEGVSAKQTRVMRVTPARLARGLKGSRLVEARRRGKYLLVSTDRDKTLLMHFGMTGDLFFLKKGAKEARFTKMEIRFIGGGRLAFTDPRMFGRIALYDTTVESEIRDVADLGPEPLDRSFTFKKFEALLAGHRTTIHQLLMDQSLIAGIGNIYSDEITYQAGVLPYRRTAGLSTEEARRLYDKMKWTLRRAIDKKADLDQAADVFLIPHRGKGGECPKGHALERRTIGGRTSWYCPKEQK